MTSIAAPQSLYRPAPLRPDDDRYVPLAAELGEELSARAAELDRSNAFAQEDFDRMRASGYVRLAVPEELGGLGASMRQVCYAQAELAQHAAATAVAINMHHYLTLSNVYRWRHGAQPVEGMLRRIANEGLVLMTSGGSDGLWPSATARRVEGGYRINGRKVFCSQAPTAQVLSTMVAYDDPDEGRVVLAVGIPTSAEGLRIIDTWDTMGMRASGSHDVQLDDVFVSDAQVAARRPWGRLDPVLRNALVHFAPTVAAVYYGVALGARNEAVRMLRQRMAVGGPSDASTQAATRTIGLIESKLHTAWWSLIGALTELGDDFQYDLTDQAASTLLIAKRSVVTEAVEIVDLAMEAVGGSAYFKRSPIERAYRDVRGGKFHPLTPEKTLAFVGSHALGLSVDQIW